MDLLPCDKAPLLSRFGGNCLPWLWRKQILVWAMHATCATKRGRKLQKLSWINFVALPQNSLSSKWLLLVGSCFLFILKVDTVQQNPKHLRVFVFCLNMKGTYLLIPLRACDVYCFSWISQILRCCSRQSNTSLVCWLFTCLKSK